MSEVLSIKPNDLQIAARPTQLLGAEGEALATEFLIQNRYRIVLSNFMVPVGRNRQGAQVTGEIDIVALEGETLCFIEVKARRSEKFTPAITAIDVRKQRQITRTARIYRRIFHVMEMPYRYDVVTVILGLGSEPHIELVKSFWTDAKFAKRNWHQPAWQEF
jgi:putative endonuclease